MRWAASWFQIDSLIDVACKALVGKSYEIYPIPLFCKVAQVDADQHEVRY
jgi:hypothetical protein